jgi:hypothetical protein
VCWEGQAVARRGNYLGLRGRVAGRLLLLLLLLLLLGVVGVQIVSDLCIISNQSLPMQH